MKIINLFTASIVSLFIYHLTFAQENGTVYGRITDAQTNEPLPFANILIIGTNYGAASNENGFFRIEGVPYNTYQIRASVVGYNSLTKTDIIVQAGKPAAVNFELAEQVIQLENVVVTGDYFSNNPLEVNSIRNFSYEEIRRSPGGFEDVIRALSILPGVAQADAGRNDLIIRGGAPSENLYLIDGIEISNINHFGGQGVSGGPLSYINLDFVKETSFSTSGFSSMYGDKISSVLSIKLRDGREDRIGGKATVSASQFGLNLEGPIAGESNFIFSARRSYLDFIFKAAGFSFVPEYYDLLFKANINPHSGDQFNFLFISAFDNVKFFNGTDDQRFDNSSVLGSDQVQYLTGFSYRHLFKDGFFNIGLSRNYIDYFTRQNDLLLNPIFSNKSLEQENMVRADIIYKPSANSEMNIGGTFKLIETKYNIFFPSFKTSFGDSTAGSNLKTNNSYTKAGAYFNYNRLLFNKINFNFGFRGDIFTALNNKLRFSPRVSLSYILNELTNLNFSAGIYHQSPSYIWLEASETNKDLNMIRAEQYIAGFDRRIAVDALLKVEGFYKVYSDYPASKTRPYLVLANTGAGFEGSEGNFTSFGLEPLVSSGYGQSRGVEISIQKKLSEIPYYGLLSLTYSKADYTSLDGIERSGTYDQNWLLNLSLGYKIDAFWEAAAKFRFASGSPYTPFGSNGIQRIDYLNSRRLKSAHSLDIRIDKRWYFSSWTLITYLDIQNIYNRKNSTSIKWDKRKMRADEESSIGILPSIGISAEF
ncbi:MAG TPA: TonB-dependent receptor [Ignavibacteriaceae bacterium]|nr:TonB-dependent receptor [Ignavibacteriaceae bacterium]